MPCNVVWWVAGEELQGLLFTTKEAAEKAARLTYPDEDPDKRYARIFYKEVLSAEDFCSVLLPK